MKKITSKKYKLTKQSMILALDSNKAKSIKWYKSGKTIKVDNRMQKNYKYTLTFDAGKSLKKGGLDENNKMIKYKDFNPKYTPQQMLRMGVFSGKYLNDQIFEYPKEWYLTSKGIFNSNNFSPEIADINCNFFGIKSRQSLQVWRHKGWVPCHENDKDLRGWFEWYCRYWLGRRQPEVDIIQIKRWRAFARHYGQFKKHTKGKALTVHPKRRQALLQWSYPCK
jgi:hypothetical protein